MNVFDKYVWLLNLLHRRKSLTFQEISNEWFDSDLNIRHEELCDRTFRRWCASIETMFHIEIECNRSTNEYSIDYDSKDEVTQWLLHTATMQQALSAYHSEKKNILLGRAPTGEQHLIAFMEAMQKGYQLQIVYQSYKDAEPSAPRLIMPLCVRLHDARWYAVVDFADENGEHKVIALDRIMDLQSTGEKYTMPADFNAEDYFAYDYGIAVGFNEKPCTILLKVNAQQRPYTRSLKLHSTQDEIETAADYSIFRLFMKPSNDLARAIMQWGCNIEVLEPALLREKVKKMAWAVINSNSDNK